MRIRQVRPEFFTDATIGRLRVADRLTYIGLWCCADDDGFLLWDPPQLAVQLYPYESVRVREKRITDALEALTAAGRLVIHPCGCAEIPTLKSHQRIGGNRTTTVHDKHLVHTRLDKSAGRVGNGSEGRLEARERANDDDERAAVLESFRRQGLPVDIAS